MTTANEWTSDCGTVRLICGDCLEVLPTLGKVDAVVTDPPYGLGDKWGDGRIGWSSKNIKGHGRLWAGVPDWDREPVSWFAEWALQQSEIVCWGGNYYNFPPTRAWLIWDKMQEHTGASCEMAWTNLDIPCRTFRMSRIEAYCHKEYKQHPNQKPSELMVWCLEFLKSEAILDPFMGSGTTGVACVRTGRKFIGIEREPKYFEIAKRRISDELNRFPLLESQPQPVQQTLLEGGVA